MTVRSVFNPQFVLHDFVILNLSETEDQNVSQCRVYNKYSHS